MAFMHGAQDGQKFMGVFMLGVFLVNGQSGTTTFEIPIWLMLLCSLVMGLGTSSADTASSSRSAWIWSSWKSIRGSQQYCRGRMPAPVFAYRAPGLDDSYQDYGYHGCWRRAQVIQCQLGHSQRYGYDMGAYIPRMWADRIFDGKLFMWIF